MTATYTLELPYPPRSGNGTTRTGQGRHYTVKEVVSYRQRLAIASSGLGVAGLRLPGPLRVTYWLWPPDRKARDDDNVLKVLKDSKAQQGHKVLKEDKVLKVLEEAEVIKALKEEQEDKELKELKDQKDHKVLKDQQEDKVLKVAKEEKEDKVLQVQQGLKVLKVALQEDLKGPQVQEELKVPKVDQEDKVL